MGAAGAPSRRRLQGREGVCGSDPGPRESPATPQVLSAALPLTRKDRQRPTGPDHPGMAPSRPGLDLGLRAAVDTRRSTCQSSPGQVTPSKSVLVYLGTWTPSAVRQGWGLGPCGRSLTPAGALRVDSCACVSDPPSRHPGHKVQTRVPRGTRLHCLHPCGREMWSA